MVTIIFESHATTFDNENRLSSGHFDAELSPLGINQAKELGERYKSDHFDAIFCSDLQRSYRTAEIAFGSKFPVIKDRRLMECDYGDLTGHPSDEVEPEKIKHVTKPFPNGESYEQTNQKVRDFLEELKEKYDGKRVMTIGHRATQYGLDTYIKGLSLEALLAIPFKWQPGWEYTLS